MVIDNVPKYEELAPVLKQLRANGASINAIGLAYKMPCDYVKQVLKFADTGERPTKAKKDKSRGAPAKPSEDSGTCKSDRRPKYQRIASEVVKLRENDRLGFAEIGKRLEASKITVQKAYDFARPDNTLSLLVTGKRSSRP